ncbi:hypothetical protein GGR26_000227 [Lewinella marina]|uniref:Uncharacterized protein n=1 Tax=Neolewinella marina TaxID=438751 RepID=A0A2G0CK32_9BACT|nr:hypothetical protein [Neolewinella marina]NJB84482.1 hypothetical protein [Neolewinella marina]PHL00326.1 hypothetical protein CGL56_04650 [Neolewinella marina]
MKDLHFTLIFLALILGAGTTLTAQVSARQQAMSRGDQPSLVLELPGAEDDDVEDLWTDWLKDTYGVKTKSTKGNKQGELSSLNFQLEGVGRGSKVDLYSRVNEVGDGSELTIWIATPAGYVSPALDQGQYVAAEKMLMNFALAVSRDQIEQDVESEEDQLSDLEKELDRLRRDKEKAEKDIVDARQKIADLEEEIRRNILDQERKQREIEEQISRVEATKRKLKGF